MSWQPAESYKTLDFIGRNWCVAQMPYKGFLQANPT